MSSSPAPARTASTENTASWPIYRRLLGYVKPYRLYLIGAFVAMALDAGAYALFTRLLEPLLDKGLVDRDPEVIRWLPFAVIGLIAGRAVASFCGHYGIAAAGRSVVRDLRAAVFRKYLSMPASYFDTQSSGKVIGKITYNIEQVAMACTNAITIISRDTMIIIGLLSVMFWYSAKLSLAVLIIGPLIALVIRLVSRRFRRHSEHIQDSMGEVTQVAEELVTGHRVVKVFGGEDQERSAFDRVNQFNRRQHLKLQATQSLSSGLVQIAAGLALAGIIYAATGPLDAGQFTAGSFSAYMLAMLGILPSLRRLTNVHSVIQTGVAGADSVFAVLDAKSEEDSGRRELEQVTGHLEFRNVTLRYEGTDEDALNDISFDVPAGSVTALVGESGGGKSSIVNLIPRFYEPRSGEVLLDGVSVRELSLTTLRTNIAFVSQDVVLFNDSVERNIAYGALAARPRDAVVDAARKAHALEFIEQLPDGFETRVGPRGVRLSGGQRQRIAIARAILKAAPILILDEATSALDSKSERLIQQALETVMLNRTTLVIAHRLSTIEQADQVVVVHEGQVVERGSHAELLAAGGRYAKLHKLQFKNGG